MGQGLLPFLASEEGLAVACIEKEMPVLVDQIVDWVTNYVDTNLAFVDNRAWRMGEFSYITIIILKWNLHVLYDHGS